MDHEFHDTRRHVVPKSCNPAFDTQGREHPVCRFDFPNPEHR